MTTRRLGPLEYEAVGTGMPVTVFGHGLGSGIAETRPLGSGVAGTKVFPHFRGHGGSAARPSAEGGYAALAGDLEAVAGAVGASRAVGVSMGAGALCRLLATRPDRFERLVFFLPAVLDEPGPPSDRLGATEEELRRLIDAGLPAGFRERPEGRAYRDARAATLASPGVRAVAEALSGDVAVLDAAVLAAVTAPALVVGARGDGLHPLPVAERLAAALPAARLAVFDRPVPLITARAEVRTLLTTFLNRA
ncbi:MAG: alpha/beta fold hydrolase [Mycobacteriales bacterium]